MSQSTKENNGGKTSPSKGAQARTVQPGKQDFSERKSSSVSGSRNKGEKKKTP